MAERSTPETRRRDAYKQMQTYMDKDKRKRGAITKRQDEAYAEHLRTGSTTLLDKHGKQYIPPGARAKLAEERAERGKGRRGREAATMLGAADIVTTPLMAGQFAKWAGKGAKAAFTALAKRKAKKKANETRPIRDPLTGLPVPGAKRHSPK